MTTLAKFRKQRPVRRGAWKARFTNQKLNSRGSSTFTAPTLTSISPSTGVHGAANQTVTCTGTGFITGVTKVTIGFIDTTTTFVSATSVTFVMPLSQFVAGTQSINVRNGTKFSTTPKTYTVT
jgi:hypothetical protein